MRGRVAAGVLVAALAASVFAVHPVGYLTSHPYWADEAWVALLSRAPLGQFVALSSSTPIGWVLLVRWSPFGRDGLRMVSLLFAAGDVAMAYVVARSLRWQSEVLARAAGATAAVLVLLAPVSLVQHDLKQYTSDAFFTLVVVALAIRVEDRRSRSSLAVLVAGSFVAIVFSTVCAFVVVAVFVSLFVVEVAARKAGRVRDVTIAGATAAAGLAAYFAAVIVPHDNRALRDYWRSYYLDGGPFHEAGQVWHRLDNLSPRLAVPAVVFVLLVALGALFAARVGNRAVALAVPLLWVEMIAVGALHRYPFLDERTSHFLLVLSITFVGVGLVGAGALVASRSQVVAAILAFVALGLVVARAEPYFRARSIANEDVRSQVLYVAGHRRPTDIVIVNVMADYGLSYYWPGAKSSFYVDHSGTDSNGYFVRVSNVPGVLYAGGRSISDTTSVLRRALAVAAREHAPVRIWIVRTHLSAAERNAWAEGLRTLGLHAASYYAGPEPLLFVDTTTPAGA